VNAHLQGSKEKRSEIGVLTSLTPEEFDFLLPAFEQSYLRTFPVSKTITGQKVNERRVEVEKELWRV